MAVNIKAKPFSIFILILVPFFFQACCSCTEMACHSAESPMIHLSIRLDDYPELSEEDLQNLRIIQTNKTFDPIDTISSSFVPKEFGGNEYVLTLDAADFDSTNELSGFYYLIENDSISQTDTVSHISYNIETNEEVCNECDGALCEDEMYTAVTFTNMSFQYNQDKKESFEVAYLIR